MNARMREPYGRIFITVLLALFLSVVPVPGWFDAARPAFLVLTVLYWSIAVPRAGGLTLGWIAGLALDIFQGSILGQHALALSLVTYIAVREHQKIRSKPVFQQSLIIMGALFIYEFVVFAIDGWTGHVLYGPLRWLQILTGALLWPLAAALLGRSHAPR
ncbi:MAG TPA: rod shape-determining protein MreD [Steroidobacteraceae bacterium]